MYRCDKCFLLRLFIPLQDVRNASPLFRSQLNRIKIALPRYNAMKQLLSVTFLAFSISSIGQKVFFKSEQSFTETQLKSFYSSLRLQGNTVLFIGQDYTMYAYDKETGKPKWNYYLRRKSNIPPFFAGDYIWAMSDEVESVQLDTLGREIRKLPFSVETQPVVKNGILYTTGIYDFGCLIAYDMKSDTVIWSRFLAHGCSREPYYLDNMIMANAEGNHWLPVNYNGTLPDSACDIKDERFPSGLPCAETFNGMTHDGKKISGKLAAKLFPDDYGKVEIQAANQHTFIFYNGVLTVLGNKLKQKFSEPIYKLSEEIGMDDYTPSRIVKADNSFVWLVYNNKLISFNYKKKSLERVINLEEWEPHQLLMDENRLWVISKKDGLLYGLSIL